MGAPFVLVKSCPREQSDAVATANFVPQYEPYFWDGKQDPITLKFLPVAADTGPTFVIKSTLSKIAMDRAEQCGAGISQSTHTGGKG